MNYECDVGDDVGIDIYNDVSDDASNVIHDFLWFQIAPNPFFA
jgi:hypothetical protein